MRSASIRHCSASPDIIVTNRARSRSARGNEKGRVERAIRYVRDAFFAARSFTDLDDLNAQAEAWCNGPAADRRCPDDPRRSVREVFADEAPRLLALPDNPAPLLERVAVSVGKTPYVRFDLNDYSVPHTHVRRMLTVLADPHEVRIVDGARRARLPSAQLRQGRADRRPRPHPGAGRRTSAPPVSTAPPIASRRPLPPARPCSMRAAERGANLGAITAALMRLLERYGAAELQAAILEALERDVPHPNAVRLALERRREQRGEPPPVAVVLPAHRARPRRAGAAACTRNL